MVFYRGIDHTNTTNEEETVLTIESTEAEKKKILQIRLTYENNDGRMRAYVDRENFLEGNTYWKTNQATIENYLIYEINRVLEVGEEFLLTLLNDAVGVNAEIVGDVVYEIVE